MNEIGKQPKGLLKNTVLQRIKAEKMSPRPRVFFRSRECAVWMLWLLSVVVGALAFSVSLFVVLHHQYAFYEASHSNFFTFMVETLPYVWIVTFAVMTYAAIYNIRHTKYGYRYPLWMIMASSVVLSFAGGSTLQFFGLGYTIDDVLGEHMSLYQSQNKFEQYLWQDPDDGRLVGRLRYTTLSPTTTIIFEDINGGRWTIDISELVHSDLTALNSERLVKLLGDPSDTELHLFHACGAFPWHFDKDMTSLERHEEREEFVERVTNHARKPSLRRPESSEGSFDSIILTTPSICATIAPVYRLLDD
ncbi:hypothetical protein GW937_00795 [Candidatus Kaiserbacteria bacterium]|nr:hypothetical protein [Candidatus Kaiserbacteria bacterium]NCT01647.1 hypothetical protein [Candidatus Parcubacteria bacterium]